MPDDLKVVLAVLAAATVTAGYTNARQRLAGHSGEDVYMPTGLAFLFFPIAIVVWSIVGVSDITHLIARKIGGKSK